MKTAVGLEVSIPVMVESVVVVDSVVQWVDFRFWGKSVVRCMGEL